MKRERVKYHSKLSVKTNQMLQYATLENIS